MQTHNNFLLDSCLIGRQSHYLDLPTMQCTVSSPIRSSQPSSSSPEEGDRNIHTTETTRDNGNSASNSGNGEQGETIVNSHKNGSGNSSSSSKKENGNSAVVFRRERPLRACALRSAKLYVDPPVIERRPRPAKREKAVPAVVEEEAEEEEDEQKGQCGKVVTPLVNSPPPGQLPRWNLRAMWELASILNFLNVFRHLLNISVEFSVEELESALITPNDTLSYIHIPILKAIPPITRMACGRDTWVTVLCRKLKDWWHWVAEGELPIVAARGDEIEHYRCLDPGVRVVILKALCDIRVEQEDIRRYIEVSMKHGVHLSSFRKTRMGGDSRISYWYEDDPIIGHRLYREIRKVEVKRVKAKGSHVLPSATYEWETIATNLDEFQEVSEKLFTSKNRIEASVGKKLKNDMLPEIEKIHKRKEKLLKKQQREALLLDNFGAMDGLVAGRSLRDRKPVTYTFDAYDRSINEAIKITKQKQPFSEVNNLKKEVSGRSDRYSNGRLHRPSRSSQGMSFSPPSPSYYDDIGNEPQYHLDRSNRRRQRPQRYTDKEFVEALSDNDDEDYFDSDDDIVGEVVYDEEYLRKKKLRKKLPPSRSDAEGDEEFQWSEENEGVGDSCSMSDEEDSDGPPNQEFKKFSGQSREESKAKLWSVDNFEAGLRRSKRSTRNRMNFRQYELSESDPELSKPKKQPCSFGSHSDSSRNEDNSMDSQDSKEGSQEIGVLVGDDGQPSSVKGEPGQVDHDGSCNSSPDGAVKGRHFLDLNELAPDPGFDDRQNDLMKDEDDDNNNDDVKGVD